MEISRNWISAGVAAVCFITGVALSHVIEPGVRVEKVMLTANTPALRLFPTTPGPHPKVLLGHGSTGSKENFFRFGKALAAAGFECYSVDQAGHGESPQLGPSDTLDVLPTWHAVFANDERSRAGRVVPSTPRNGLPAWAAAIGSPRA